MNTADFSDLLARPGADTRGWVHYGLVAAETQGNTDQKSVIFNDSNGNPLPYGVLVMVKLQPNGNILPCRVAAQCAGPGESDYHPFIANDEVIVVVPNGDESNGGVILGRLNQSFDSFPTNVGGLNPNKNNIAFKRVLAPYILESGTSIMLRVAPTGSQFVLDPTGNVYLTSGNQAMLAMTPDVVSLQLLNETAAVQLTNSNGGSLLLIGGGSASNMSMDSTGVTLSTQNGYLTISAAGIFSFGTAPAPLVLASPMATLLTAISAFSDTASTASTVSQIATAAGTLFAVLTPNAIKAIGTTQTLAT